VTPKAVALPDRKENPAVRSPILAIATRRRLIAGMLMSTPILSGSIGASDDRCRDAEAMSRGAITLVRESLAIELPKELPGWIRRKLGEGVAEEYAEGKRYPGEAFLHPELLKDIDRPLMRRIVRFWKLDAEAHLCMVPNLVEESLREAGGMRSALGLLIGDILQTTGGVPGQREVKTTALLRLIEAEPDPRALKQQLFQIAPVVDAEGSLRLLAIGERWRDDAAVRAEWVYALRSSRPMPQEVAETLLGVVRSDACGPCRSLAVSKDVVRALGEDRAVPVYAAAAKGAVQAGNRDLFGVVMFFLSDGGYLRESLSVGIEGLGSGDVVIQADSVDAIERLLDVDESERTRILDPLLIDHGYGVDDREVARLVAARGRWLEWWTRSGEALFTQGECDELKRSAGGTTRKQ
jgi:hypothetical protein